MPRSRQMSSVALPVFYGCPVSQGRAEAVILLCQHLILVFKDRRDMFPPESLGDAGKDV